MAQDPYKYFRVEARELLEQLGKTVLDLERRPAPELIARLLRLAHTLKGAARVVRQSEIADQAHAVEDALAPFRELTATAPRDLIDTVLRFLDDMSRRVAALTPPSDSEGGVPDPTQPEELLGSGGVDRAGLNVLFDGVYELTAQFGSMRRNLVSLGRARDLLALMSNQLAAPRARDSIRAGSMASSEKVRSIAGELSVLLGRLERALASGVDQIDRELRQVLDAAEQLRLVPAGALFASLERTARDTAQAMGKRVIFEGLGGDVRMDFQVLGAVRGALLQAVRNAVAHGIELEAGRKLAGKPAEGRVTLDVRRRGRKVAFTCRDDGRGVDLEGVQRAIHRKGIPSTNAQALGPEELLRMLLKGGISTSSTITEVSGRGIGLDVLREAAECLGGEVEVHTQVGKGTTVDLIVPLSLASVEALVVDSAGITTSIPLDAVQRTLRIETADIARSADGDSVVHEGRVIPFMPLSRALPSRLRPARGSRTGSAVVVQGETGVAAIGVDHVLGTASVMLRPLPELAPAAAVVAGTSLDAEGNPQLVLDPDALVISARRTVGREDETEVVPAPVLVIDDSLTTRMLEQSILESAGYEVDQAISGEEALEKARRRRYALFLVDIEMPGMDGFTFIERIHADPLLRDIPSILVSSRASTEDRRRGVEVGAMAYIVKSEFDQGELLGRIRELVG